MTIALCILLALYLIVMLYMMVGWQKAKRTSVAFSDSIGQVHGITVLIPFRNEKENLPRLLLDLLHMNGGRSSLHIILIDDHSTDGTRAEIESFLDPEHSIELMVSKGQGKIAALKTGLNRVKTDYIVTLDADIRLTTQWYHALLQVVQSEPDMCILPVLGLSTGNFASAYAQIDFMSLIGVTFGMAGQGRPVMANGAQLLMRTDCAKWDDDVVSGDDVFALHGLKSAGGTITYALSKPLIALTAMPSDWRGVWSQRVRWASKAVNYRDMDTLALGWMVLAVNVGLWVLLFKSLFDPATLSLFLAMLLTKALIDLAFLIPVMRWFDKGHRLGLFPIACLLNFVQYPLVFIAGRLIGFSWKDRNYRNE